MAPSDARHSERESGRPARFDSDSPHFPRLADGIALALSLLAVLAAWLVADRVYERLPHIEDEIAFAWQAAVIADGRLTIPSPPHAAHFLVPFVVDYEGQRFSKYPLGWPALLSLGVRGGARAWVNPLMAGLAVWLTYCLGKRLLGEPVGALAALLTVISPFFFLNTGSLLSHPMGLVLSLAFALGWLGSYGAPAGAERRGLANLAAAGALGLLALTRPLTAIGVAVPFGLHGIALLIRGDRAVRVRLLTFGLVVGSLSSLHFLWQFAVTGDPWLNPYTLWWAYDRVGFGPGVGRMEGGHTLRLALSNTRFSLRAGARDLFGWGAYSWVFLPFGVWAVRRRKEALLVGGMIVSLVGAYMLYWVGSWVYGPRYYFEALHSLTILSAAGIAWLGGWAVREDRASLRVGAARVRRWAITALVALLVTATVVFYAPIRLNGMRGLNGFSRDRLAPFRTETARALTPALFIVRPDYWTSYGVLISLENPQLTSPMIFALSRGPGPDAELAATFSDRNVLHYDPDRPYTFVRMVRE